MTDRSDVTKTKYFQMFRFVNISNANKRLGNKLTGMASKVDKKKLVANETTRYWWNMKKLRDH